MASGKKTRGRSMGTSLATGFAKKTKNSAAMKGFWQQAALPSGIAPGPRFDIPACIAHQREKGPGAAVSAGHHRDERKSAQRTSLSRHAYRK
jgi:hypothetical protein